MKTIKECETVIDNSNPFLVEHYLGLDNDELTGVRMRLSKERIAYVKLKKDPKYIDETILLIDAIMERNILREVDGDKGGYSIG